MTDRDGVTGSKPADGRDPSSVDGSGSESVDADVPTPETRSESTDTDAPPADIDRTGPLSDLAVSVETDRKRAGDDDSNPRSTPEFDALFDREDVTELDSERLWERLEADDAAVESVGDDDRDIREIDKGSYCHQCEHFSEPPVVACTREGTDILDLPSLETFRVADCPVVREDEALENRY